jgi:DNA-binding response OmpR family regulator
MSPFEGWSILLIEDEYLIAADAEQMLHQLGVRAIELVGDLEEAQARARDGAYNAAVLDVNLDGKLSFPVAKILQSRGIPFVFATGYSLQQRPLPGFESGVCVTKPYSVERLKTALLAAAHAQGLARPADVAASPRSAATLA